MFGRSTGPFDRLLDKATSKLLLDPDWDSVIQICDAIRQGDVVPSYAVQGIRRKIENENPHVAKFALQVLESAVKNCGSIVHIEIATRDFMDFLKDQAKKRQDPVKAKIVELIQVWSHAFRNEPSYKVVQDTFSAMKSEGFAFPALKESDAMFMAEKAPDWRDGELCHRCRVPFTTFNRKHHCRACGQVFCAKCSSKNSIIPKFGIEKEVRVCDCCYDQLNKPVGEKKSEDELPTEYVNSSLAKQSQAPPSRSEQEIQEEEELQLALALSQSEAEAKEKERQRMKQGFGGFGHSPSTNDNSSSIYAQPVKVSAPAAVIDTSDMDPELARYLNRNYWQQKSIDIKTSTTQPSAPTAIAETKTSSVSAIYPAKEEEKFQNGETDDKEQFLNALRSSIEIFVNRMKSNSQRGRSIANDSSVQTLFMTLSAMNPQLMKYIHEQEDLRAHYETLQDKLTQLKDARDALDVLRDEHREKRRREQEELERQRQIQMVQKLEVLRQKKQEYLEYQRQLALQRMQEQEMEMKRRHELLKQEQQMRAMQYGYPQVYGQPGQTFSPSGSTEGSPMHQMHGQPNAVSYPGNQMPMSMPPSTGLGMAPPPGTVQSGPPMHQHMPPGTIGAPPPGSIYSQPGPGGYAPPGQVGYHMPPPTQGNYQVHGMSGGGPTYQPAGMGQQPGGVYMTAPSVEYQQYNMQGIATSLPQPGQMQSGGYMNMAPPPQQGTYAAQGGPPPPPPQSQPQMQHQPGPNEAELINFD